MSISAQIPLPPFELTANALCLDFANTIRGRLSDEPLDLLVDYPSLLRFGREAGLIDPAERDRLREMADARPDEAAAVHQRALVLREGLYRLMDAVARGEEPDAADLQLLQDAARDAFAHGELRKTEDGYRWDWTCSTELAGVLWPVAGSALEILRSDQADRVRQCAADHCGWLFLDLSRNRSRRWCTMSTCGNRAKASRYRERHAEG